MTEGLASAGSAQPGVPVVSAFGFDLKYSVCRGGSAANMANGAAMNGRRAPTSKDGAGLMPAY
jgi:hypothetical protein